MEEQKRVGGAGVAWLRTISGASLVVPSPESVGSAVPSCSMLSENSRLPCTREAAGSNAAVGSER